MPVYEGFSLPHAMTKLEIGRYNVTQFLMKFLKKQGYKIKNSDFEYVRKTKEELCYVALDYEEELEKSKIRFEIDELYILPDGNSCTVGKERFECTEILFNPKLISDDKNDEREGIAELFDKSIMKCDIAIRKDLYLNIVLSGGNTLFKGFDERIKKEIVERAPGSMKVDINVEEDRENLAWKGGSILSSLSNFKDMCVSKKEYEEYGFSILHRKCI